MQDPETQAALDRIHDRNSWSAAWILCGMVSLIMLIRVFFDWHARNLAGRLEAAGLIFLLILFPARLMALRKQRKPISPGWVFMIAYILLMMGVQTFGKR